MTNQPLALQFGEHGERFFDGALCRPDDSSYAKVDDVQLFQAEVSEIVVNGIDQFLTRKSMNPGFVRSAASANFGHDYQAIRIRMEGLLDNLIGNVGTIIVAGVDVVY